MEGFTRVVQKKEDGWICSVGNQFRPRFNIPDGLLTVLSLATFQSLQPRSIFLPLVWWRPPFIWCNWEATCSSVASAISPGHQKKKKKNPEPSLLFCWDTCLRLPQTLPTAPLNEGQLESTSNCGCPVVQFHPFYISFHETFGVLLAVVPFAASSARYTFPFFSAPAIHNPRLAAKNQSQAASHPNRSMWQPSTFSCQSQL